MSLLQDATREDITQPIIYIDGALGATDIMYEHSQRKNNFALTERESHGKRTRIRVAFEVWTRTDRRMDYVRLKRCHAVLSVPSSEQAQLVIDLIRQVCQSLDGKHLAPK